MSKSFQTIIVLMFFFAGETFGQSFNSLTSRILFDADLKITDTNLISYFQTRPELTKKIDTGWIMYPPTLDTDNVPVINRFIFYEHPYFESNFTRGSLTILTSRRLAKIVGMSLSLSFASKETFNKTYDSLKVIYTKCSLSVIKRPNISRPFEVTKFVSINGTDYVIITKQEDTNVSYINIAYNYQGYEW